MNIETTRFGSIDIPEELVINFPEGLPGFEGNTYALVHSDENPNINWLQSASDPDIALIIMDPLLLKPDYEVKPRPNELGVINVEDNYDEKVVLRVIARAGENAGELYLNLFAPLIFNVGERLGMQLALVGSNYTIREVINFGAPSASSTAEEEQTG
jgi:flagellar assembly factor FliW